MPCRRLRLLLAAPLAAALLALSACEKVDDKRVPAAAVRIDFQTQGVWEAYGVAGATDFRYFIKAEKKPDGFPYSAIMETGFGGVLLVSDILGDPRAYDLACPVENRQSVRVRVDTDENIARCPECGSTYDIFSNYGQPLSGPASQKAYGLTKYSVSRGTSPYMIITR